MTGPDRNAPATALDEAVGLVELGISKLGLCEYPAAVEALERAWRILAPLDRPAEQGVCLFYLAVARGDAADAPVDPAALQRALVLLEAGEERLSAGDCCSALARREPDPVAKDAWLARAIAHYRHGASLLRLPRALERRSRAALERGEPAIARPWIDEALDLVRRVELGRNARWLEAQILETKGDLLVATRRRGEGLNVYRAAEQLLAGLERDRDLDALESKTEALSMSIGRWTGSGISYDFGDVPDERLRRNADGTLEAACWRSRTSEDYYDESASYEIVVWDSGTGDVRARFTRTWSLAKNSGEQSGRPLRDVQFRPSGELIAVYDDGFEEVLSIGPAA